jgi:molybdopterin synthase catalytic subunit/molybdopterin converting factor small subunit
MKVRILPFGVLKDWLGASTVDMGEGATVEDLLAHIARSHPGPAASLRGIAVSVNAEYAPAARILRDGDEVGLLPPVSGGSARTEGVSGQPVMVNLTRDPIDAQPLIAQAKHGEDGAVVVFDGIVRDHTRNRQTLYLDYEAYEEMALKQMDSLSREALTRFGVRHVTLVHRLGRLQVGETSVLIVVSSAHRAPAFDACRWLIDTLKKTVPIWKKETFVDGAVWAPGDPFPESIAVSTPETPHAS